MSNDPAAQAAALERAMAQMVEAVGHLQSDQQKDALWRRRFVRWTARGVAVTFLAVLGMVAAIVLAFHVASSDSSNNHALIACVSNWANQTNSRSSMLTSLANKRQEDLTAIISDEAAALTQGANSPAVVQKFGNDVLAYLAADKAYKQAAAAHPIPPAPRLVCRGLG